MRDLDTKHLAEAYQLILEGKALTPEQIIKKGKAAGSQKSSDMLSSNNKEGSETEQPSDNNPENIDQDNKNTEVKDPYVLKETESDSETESTEDNDVTGVKEAVEPTKEFNAEDFIYEYAMSILADLEEADEKLRSVDPAVARQIRLDLTLAIKRTADDFKYGRLPNQSKDNSPTKISGTERSGEGTPSKTDYGSLHRNYGMDV